MHVVHYMNLHASPCWWRCVLAGLSVVTVLGVAPAVHAADMELAPPPTAHFELSRPEAHLPPPAHFDQSHPHIEQPPPPVTFEAAHPDTHQLQPADFEASRPEIAQ